jgi:hypothetical protein
MAGDDKVKSKRATKRVGQRKLNHKWALQRGLPSTAALAKEAKEALAKAKGFNDRMEAERARLEAVAKAQGFNDRSEARLSRDDDQAKKKGFKDRIEAERAARNKRAARQLGDGADANALQRLLEAERRFATTVGVDVGEIRRLRTRADQASSSTLAVPSVAPTPLVLASLLDAATLRWNIGDRFTVPSEDGRRRLFQVIRIPSDDQSLNIDFQEIFDSGEYQS